MPNGKYDPACYNCAHLISGSSEECCGIHDFVMPHIRYNGNVKICKDFALRSEFSKDHGFAYMSEFLEGAEFGRLEAGALYYDASYSHGKQFYGELDKFEALKNFVFDVEIVRDDEFGWAILLERFSEERRQFPRNGSRIVVQMGDVEYSYTIRRVRRPVFVSASQQNDKWVVKRRKKTLSIICSETSPTKLRDWLDEWIDAEAAWKDCMEMDIDRGIVAFMETITDGESYRLRPATHFAQDFLGQ